MLFRTNNARVGDLVKAAARHFAADNSAVSAIEFALLLPFMMTLYLGGIQLSQGIEIDRKVTLASRTVADLTAQVSSIDTAGVTTVLNAATQVMSPYADSAANASNLMVRVSVIKIDGQSKATVDWSKAKNGSPLTTGELQVPAALIVPNTYLVLGEARYAYTPPIGYALTGTMNLEDKIYMRPRLSASVECPSCKI
jgi:Flp pilus assembly protein TadG